jgi:hypothetical protein
MAWPAFMVTIGLATILFARPDRPLPPEALEKAHP